MEDKLFSLIFWRKSGERVIESSAALLLTMIGGTATGLFGVDWKALLTFMISVLLMCIVGSRIGDHNDPSFFAKKVTDDGKVDGTMQ